jgi:acetyl-CoA acyltransferase
MREAVIVDAVRTAVGRGRPDGKLAGIHPVDMLATTISALLSRTGADPNEIGDVIAGCVSQAGEQSGDIARNALLAAGLPVTVPGVTVDRRCGSSQQAVQFAAHAIMAGSNDLVVACGVESMSALPLLAARMGRDPFGSVTQRFGQLVHQGISAELVAARWHLNRVELDEFALGSHEAAARATREGCFAKSLIPISAMQVSGSVETISEDEGIRRDTSMEKLAALPPAFLNTDYKGRFPQIQWLITAGNSSQVSDGAAALLIAEREYAESHGMRPRARLHSFAVVGVDPIMMLTGVIPATQRVLERAGLSITDIGYFEVSEAFASVVLAWLTETKVPRDRVNVHGGAIAIGHPLGASGARLITSLLETLEQNDARFGLAVMCEGGGQANATIIERLQ